jgi:hypothetical protein
MDRRKFLRRSLAAVVLGQTAASPLHAFGDDKAVAVGQKLPAWSPGHLEIHHIATNRGNATLLILPDRTTMLVNAGAVYGDPATLGAARPSDEMRPGEYIGRYCQRRVLGADLWGLDYFLATNLSEDHLGALPPNAKRNAEGYVPTGISDVATWMPVKHYIDRGWPEYKYPVPLESDFLKNYRAFLRAKIKAGAKVQGFKVATRDQIPLLHNPMSFPTCEVRNIAANGVVWGGDNDESKDHFPALEKLEADAYPTEGMCSCAIRVRYGRFRYYNGGDLTNGSKDDDASWRDIETPVAKACGKVSVADANHRGDDDANGEAFVQLLKPKVWVVPSWGSEEPSGTVLGTLGSTDLYSDDRDIFATLLKDSTNHVVVRVEPGGGHFYIHLLSNKDEGDRVLASLGPYSS